MELPTSKKLQPSNSGQQSCKPSAWSYLAIVFPILIPVCHILLFRFLWEHKEVERRTCTCGCWDNVFKGPYEQGVAGYKHIYFNATSNSLKIWTVTIFFFIGMYEIAKKMIALFLLRKLRLSMALLFCISFHSHYYAWWAMFNYWNDDYNAQWNHQMFFTVTELISTAVVVTYLDRRVTIRPLPLLVTINIALAHILCGSWDNFVENVLLQKGGLHQILRDIALMSTDVLYAGICLLELRIYAKSNGESIKTVLFQKNHLTFLGWFTAIMYVVVLFL